MVIINIIKGHNLQWYNDSYNDTSDESHKNYNDNTNSWIQPFILFI